MGRNSWGKKPLRSARRALRSTRSQHAHYTLDTCFTWELEQPRRRRRTRSRRNGASNVLAAATRQGGDTVFGSSLPSDTFRRSSGLFRRPRWDLLACSALAWAPPVVARDGPDPMRQKYLTAFRRCSFRCVAVGLFKDDNPSDTHSFQNNRRNPRSSALQNVQNTMRCSSPLKRALQGRPRRIRSRHNGAPNALATAPRLRGGTDVRWSLGCRTLKTNLSPLLGASFGAGRGANIRAAASSLRSICPRGARPL